MLKKQLDSIETTISPQCNYGSSTADVQLGAGYGREFVAFWDGLNEVRQVLTRVNQGNRPIIFSTQRGYASIRDPLRKMPDFECHLVASQRRAE